MKNLPLTRLLALIILQLGFECPLGADPLAGIYPDVLNCFKGIARADESWAVKQSHSLRNKCKKLHPDETSTCHKNCLFERMEMILLLDHPSMNYLNEKHNEGVRWTEINKMIQEKRTGYNYTINPTETTYGVCHILGVNREAVPDEEFDRVSQLIAKCQTKSFIVPTAERLKCEDLAPEYQVKLGELIGCLEDVLKTC